MQRMLGCVIGVIGLVVAPAACDPADEPNEVVIDDEAPLAAADDDDDAGIDADADEDAVEFDPVSEELAEPVDPSAFAEACMPDTTCAGPKTCTPFSAYEQCDAGVCVSYYASCDTFITRAANNGSAGALKIPKTRYRTCTMKNTGATCVEWQQSIFYSCGHGC